MTRKMATVTCVVILLVGMCVATPTPGKEAPDEKHASFVDIIVSKPVADNTISRALISAAQKVPFPNSKKHSQVPNEGMPSSIQPDSSQKQVESPSIKSKNTAANKKGGRNPRYPTWMFIKD